MRYAIMQLSEIISAIASNSIHLSKQIWNAIENFNQREGSLEEMISLFNRFTSVVESTIIKEDFQNSSCKSLKFYKCTSR